MSARCGFSISPSRIIPSGFPKYGTRHFVPAFTNKYKHKHPCLRRCAVTFALQETSTFRVTQVPPVPTEEFYAASVLANEDVAPGIRCIAVEAEISRELVHIDDAYSNPGQLAQVRVKGEEELLKVPVCSPPFSKQTNWTVLYKMRGDMPSGSVKSPNSTLSVKAPLHLHVSLQELPSLYAVEAGDEVQVGPFMGTGLDLRPVLFISGFPTVVMFASGRGIAVMRAIIEAREGDTGSISLGFREEVRLYYSGPDPTQIAYKKKFEDWENRKVKIRTSVRNKGGKEWDGFVGSFSDLWDEDDIEYDPDTTAAIVCVDDDDRIEIKELLSDAGIPEKQVIFWDAAL